MHELAYSALYKVNLGTIIVDQDFNIILWNNWLERWTGHSAESMTGHNLLQIYPQFARRPYIDILNKALFNGQSRFCSGALHKIFIPPAEDIQNNVRQNMLVEPIYNCDKNYILIQITDMTGHYTRVRELKNVIKEIGLEYEQAKSSEITSRYQAMHDSLTGLPNRSLFNDRLGTILQLAKRNEDHFAVMFLDLDGFKEINDRFGHEAGDLTIQTVAKRIKCLLRESDTLARVGGDEFLLLFPGIKSKTDVITVADKIINDFAQVYSVLGNDVYLSASMGISIYPEDGDDVRTLIRNADTAMYNVKNKGKNNFAFFDSK